jgi:HK97 family phage portal protein
MRLFGREISLTIRKAPQTLSGISPTVGGSWSRIWGSNATDWQSNVTVDRDEVLAYSTVFACITLIAADIGKLRIKLVRQDDGIWSETASPAFSPVLRKPNRYQTRIKFIEQWITSKLIHGNTYVLKQRDNRGIVTGMYVLDPTRVTPLVAPNGDVYYQLAPDNLSNLPDQVTVPADEIIHDTMVALHHPLIGVSPIFACGVAATQGLSIQDNSTKFFSNGSRPGGVLTAPGTITAETAARLKEAWDTNYSGENYGKTAVLGEGLAYSPISVNAVDAQLIEQLKWTSEQVCACYHVPAYMVGVGAPPPYNNIEALSQQYYSQCLQSLIECLELCLDEGLGLDVVKDGVQYGVELDLDGLLRMDSATQIETLTKAVDGGVRTTNEARHKLDLPPVKGGDVIFRQQQDFPISSLSDRAAPDAKPEPAPALPAPEAPEPDPEAEAAKTFMATHKAIEAARLEMAA